MPQCHLLDMYPNLIIPNDFLTPLLIPAPVATMCDKFGSKDLFKLKEPEPFLVLGKAFEFRYWNEYFKFSFDESIV